MDQIKEQRVCIKFCANLEKSATETLTLIQQAFRDQILSRTHVFQWHAKFVLRILTGDKKQQRVTSALKFVTKWLSSPTHRSPLIWHRVTSSYFKK
jgi:metal-responsive CopG/Arc/MetJ family transcriptional regulator